MFAPKIDLCTEHFFIHLRLLGSKEKRLSQLTPKVEHSIGQGVMTIKFTATCPMVNIKQIVLQAFKNFRAVIFCPVKKIPILYLRAESVR